jgi:sulfite exporter TauE/SafE
MSQVSDFKQLARKAYLSYHQDGLIDLIIGLGVLAYGMNFATDESFWSITGWVPIILYVPLKNKITVPRFGYFKLDEADNVAKKVVGFLVMFLLVISVLGMAMFLVADAPAPAAVLWIRENTLLFYGLIAAVGFGFAGLISNIKRMFAYALVGLALMAVGQLLGLQEFIPFMLFGGTILVTGLVLLVNFIQKYPVSTEE